MLTVGQQEMTPFLAAPQHHYLIRSIERPATRPPQATVIIARGPFDERAERDLLETHRIEVLVTKNSGGEATRPKLDAARALGTEVVIVARPPMPEALHRVRDAAGAMRWLDTQAALRGE